MVMFADYIEEDTSNYCLQQGIIKDIDMCAYQRMGNPSA